MKELIGNIPMTVLAILCAYLLVSLIESNIVNFYGFSELEERDYILEWQLKELAEQQKGIEL